MLALYLIAGLLVGLLVYRLHLDPLSHIPGPFLAKFIPICNIRMLHTGRIVFTFRELHDTYGPVVRIGPSELSFATVTAFDSIYGFEGEKKFTIYGSRRGVVSSASGTDESLGNATSKESRRKLRPLITSTLNELMASSAEEYCHLALTEQLAAHRVGQDGSTPISLSTLNYRYLWQLANMVAFGNRGQEAHRETFNPHIRWPSPFVSFIDLLFIFCSRATIQQHARTAYKAWQAIRFVCRQTTQGPQVDFIADDSTFPDNLHRRLRQAAEKAGLDDVSDFTLLVNSMILRFSVYGTSDHMINAVFYYLLRHPQCLKRLEKEVLNAGTSVEELSDNRLAKLPYLNACINETFRISPAFNGGILQRVSCGATVDGVYVPPGVAVTVDNYTLGRSKQYWENPDAFCPERWLESSDKNVFKASRPFLIGSRQCPGRQMAYQMFRILVAKLVYLYSMELVNKDFDIERDTFCGLHWADLEVDAILKPRTDVLGY
ncbi:hypothetical protein ASPBRDRAFT_192866 [Aspergillus brasiliensis CBS 101740]|uniref:Cytochrome P450 monooxygenase bfoB n=1 Tax=Aspergillus brasiliensis (strain CBS 101740 / IMI 381727 / IBT 21946) TaxID=767769 RepID=BFOB_ASPBC|nr:RecName: Full=Cytochrome P450 monooxygenase bfoB; AltName: Full=Bifonsecin B biosynthesis cluster protein B; Flags: Precursor [Aspergillus brasiliensis CBS 101740]OJJ74130.1 hypothetical protein ASPBRDRAFT_192866 [Aspergillus brasiliensis CBS 101740]